jgi:AbiU2
LLDGATLTGARGPAQADSSANCSVNDPPSPSAGRTASKRLRSRPRRSPAPAGAPLMAEDLIEKWTRWIGKPIHADVITMNHRRQIWRGLGEVIRDHGSLPDSAFWQYYIDIYAATQAMAVRRQGDLDRRVASLARLLSQIAKHAELVTPEWWIGLWNIEANDDYKLAYARGQWDHTFGGEVGVHLDPAVPRADLKRLRNESNAVKKYVDKHIAHSEDPGPPKDPGTAPPETTLTVDEVDHAIDVIGEIFTRYYSLFTAAGMAFLEPAIQHDWLAPFRQPWIPPGKTQPR